MSFSNFRFLENNNKTARIAIMVLLTYGNITFSLTYDVWFLNQSHCIYIRTEQSCLLAVHRPFCWSCCNNHDDFYFGWLFKKEQELTLITIFCCCCSLSFCCLCIKVQREPYLGLNMLKLFISLVCEFVLLCLAGKIARIFRISKLILPI